jgi:glycosyltransferase involved in cell wall biosynthesis
MTAAMRVLYVCNDLPYYDAHRRWLADAARQAGARVMLACGGVPDARRDEVDVVLDIERHRLDLQRDFGLAGAIRKAVVQLKPDVVHLITIKPVLFGAVGLTGEATPRRIVATFPGLGRVFDEAGQSLKARLRRGLVVQGLRQGLRPERVRAIFETEADRATLLRYRVLDEKRAVHIPGAGVDPAIYPRSALPAGRLRVLFASRMLRSKGVLLVAEAATLAAAQGADLDVVIAGGEQPGDPDALSAQEIAGIAANPHVTWLGAVTGADMPALIASCHAVVLPTTYQEGVPRILIEAAAIGRALIVSDNRGCRAIVGSPEAGLMLEDLTPATLASAFARLARDGELTQRLADGAHRRFLDGRFSTDAVSQATLALYNA